MSIMKGIWSYEVINIRDFGIGKHNIVDDKQYGGGCGMVIRPDVLSSAIEKTLSSDIKSIYCFSPRGKKIAMN